MTAPLLPGSTYLPHITPYPANNAPYPPQSGYGAISLAPQTGYSQPSFQHPSQAYPVKEQDSFAKEKLQSTALLLEAIQKVSGYENTTFSTTLLPPPAYPEPQQPQSSHTEIKSFAGITEEDAREAVIKFVSEHCCYGKNTARDMKIREITMSSAFHYILETFAEKRGTAFCYDPYGGEPLDTTLNGIPPRPWEIPLPRPKQFKDSVLETEVPHTASAIPCTVCIGFGLGYVCTGLGRERCNECDGFCQVKCTWCNGSGKRFGHEICTHCTGDGKSGCTKCHGTGQMECRACAGKGRLKCYVKLTTTWKNHKDDFIFEQTNLPSELIRNVTGQVVFQEECPRVWPIKHFPQFNVNEASNNMIAKHNQECSTERILQQRQQIRIVPVAQVQYTWKEKNGNFFVYGFENEVYFPNYPQSCCWSCNIL